MKVKRTIIFSGIFLALAILITLTQTLSQESPKIILLDAQTYNITDIVTIALNYSNFENTKLEIINKGKKYDFLNPQPFMKFLPKEYGLHVIQFFKNSNLIDETDFNIISPLPENEITPQEEEIKHATVSVDKNSYLLGESVAIIISADNLQKYNLEIITENKTYKFFTLTSDLVSFFPAKPGTYKLVLKEIEAIISESSFEVAFEIEINPQHEEEINLNFSEETKPEENEIPGFENETINTTNNASSETNQSTGVINEAINETSPLAEKKNRLTELPELNLRIKDKKNKDIIYKAYVTEELLNDKLKIAAASQPGQQNLILILDNSAVKKIEFNSANFDAASELRLDRLEKEVIIEGHESVNSYAIDPTKLDFESAQVTVTAKGNELWKCKVWDYDNEACLGTWEKLQSIIPGQDYTFTLTPDDPGFSETNWWNSSWPYRSEINVTNTYGNITEYQIRFTFDTRSLINAGKMNSSCNDIRVTNDTGGLIHYYIDENPRYQCNSTETLLWIKTDTLVNNTVNRFYIYYGNMTVDSLSNMTGVFTYSQPKPIYYTVGENVYDGTIAVLAYRNNTNVTVDGSSLILNESQVTTFTTVEFGGTGASSINTSGPLIGGDSTTAIGAEISPISWASTEFVVANGRGAYDIYFYSPFQAVTISCYEAAVGAGTWGTADDTASCSAQGACAATTFAWTTGRNILCNSTAPFLMFVEQGGNVNWNFPIYPASENVWAISDSRTTILRQNVYVEELGSDGSNVTGNQSIGYHINKGDGADGSGIAWHFMSSVGLLGSNENADGDGNENAVYLPEFELEKEYYLYKDGDYVAMAVTQPNSTCNLTATGGFTNLSSVSTGVREYPYPSKACVGCGADVQTYSAGSKISCNATFAGHWETTTDDESTLFGMKSGRQYVWPEPVVVLGSEIDKPVITSSGNFNTTPNINEDTNIGFNAYCSNTPTNSIVISNVYLALQENSSGTFQDIPTIDTDVYANTTLYSVGNISPGQNSLNYTFTITALQPGVYGIRTFCNTTSITDIAYTNTFSLTVNDITPPSVTLDTPDNNTFITQSTVTFYYNVSENAGFSNCSLYLNNQLNKTNTTIFNNIRNNFTLFNIAENTYSWNVTCYDTSSLVNSSGLKIITVDFNGPQTNITSPVNFTNFSTNSINISASAADTISSVDTVTFLYRKNNTASWTTACTDKIVPYNCTLETSALEETNAYQLRAYANDTAGNTGENYTVANITIDRTGPISTITAPINFTNISEDSYEITTSVIDLNSQIDSVFFYYRQNSTSPWALLSIDTTSPYSHAWNVTSLQDKNSYQLNLYANDSLGNIGENYSVYNLTTDRTGPIINIAVPTNNSGDSDGTILFLFNVSDETSVTSNCSLIINDILDQENTTISKTENTFSKSLTTVGQYNWSISCEDNLNNSQTSGGFTFSFINVSLFTGATTDLNNVDITNIPHLVLENPSFGMINFSSAINLAGIYDINSYVTITSNSIQVDSASIPQLNAAAILNIYNLNFSQPPTLYRDGSACSSSICSFTSYQNTNLTFSVTGFTGYSSGTNAELTIYDDSDPEGGSTFKYTGEQTDFFSDYSNTSNNQPIVGSNICSIDFSDAIPAFMIYNSTQQLYVYNRTFSTSGLYFYNVTCDGSSIGGEPLNASDNITIFDETNPKVVDILPVEGTNYSVGALISIQANITDQDSIDEVYVNVTYPNGTVEQVALTPSGDIYSSNYVVPDFLGTFNLRFIANDTRGNINSTITTSFGATAAQIQCQENGTTWGACNIIDYGDILTSVRTTCSFATGTIRNATFNLKNMEDNSTFFQNISLSNSTGFWIFDNNDIKINDSGTFNLTVTCRNSAGTAFTNNSVWELPWGTLSVEWLQPQSNKDIQQNIFSNFVARVTCIGGECGSVNVTLDPQSSESYKTILENSAGLISINTNKSIYSKNEPALIYLVVLNDRGQPVQVPNLELSITDPNGHIFSLDPKFSGGLYLAEFKETAYDGNYSIYASTTLGNSVLSKSSFLVVKEDYPFDIIRTFNKFIDPWKEIFRSQLTIIPRIAVDSYTLYEYLPEDFEILKGDYETTVEDGRKIIIFSNLTDIVTLNYSAKIPLISPVEYDIYSKIHYDHNKIFEEAKPSYLAADPAIGVNFSMPDSGSPGMNLVVQFIGTNFNSSDTVTTNSSFIKVGPVIITNESGIAVSTNGRILTTTFFISSDAPEGNVAINISGTVIPRPFRIYYPLNNSGNFTGQAGTVTLGNGDIYGNRSFGGTIVLDQLIVPSGLTVNINLSDRDTDSANGNQGYFPAIILVRGTVDIQGTIDVRGSAGSSTTTDGGGAGGAGGPGGAGGGGGAADDAAAGNGGDGFTGGGSGARDESGTGGSTSGTGTGAPGTTTVDSNGRVGGTTFWATPTGGGAGALSTDAGGAGGGTGFLYGSSGAGGGAANGAGGQGGGGGGIQGAPSQGGGGGYATAGGGGEIAGQAGQVHGISQLVPLAGGSGGAGGGSNSAVGANDGSGGGGGGGGGILIYAAGTFSVSSLINATGGNGGNAVGGQTGGGGGGGSGGAVILQAQTVTVTGTMDTNGGNGGVSGDAGVAGAGGDGRLRIDGLSDPSSSFPGFATGFTGSNFTGPAIKSITNFVVKGTAAPNSNITIYQQDYYNNFNRTTLVTADSNGNFSITVQPFAGKNYVTAIQNTSGTILVTSSAGLSTFEGPKGIIPTTPGLKPFWTSSSNPQSCSNLKSGDSCQTSWLVNATGDINTTWEFYVIYNATNYSAYVSGAETNRINITITNDNKNPVVKNLTFTPNPQTVSSSVLVTVNVTDNGFLDKVIAQIVLPNSTQLNLTMDDSNYDSVYSVAFNNTLLVGKYNVTIFANDTAGNINNTIAGSFNITLENLTITTDKSQYVFNETVFGKGKGFNPFENVSITIFDPTGDPISGFPFEIFSNSTGGINFSWFIPQGSSLGTYTINATDTSDSSRSAIGTFEIVSAIIEADQTSYEQGETVYITGYSWDNNVDVTLNITNSTGTIVFGPVNVTSNSSGYINTSWFIPFNETLGNHLISGYEPSNPTKTDTFNFTVTARTVALTTQYPWYKKGEQVNLTGSGFSFSSKITLRAVDPTQDPITGYPKNVTSNSTGGFKDSFTLSASAPQGTYRINATDLNFTNLYANITFPLVAAEIETDEATYNNGEIITLTGRYWDRNVNVTINVFNNTGQNESGFPINVSTNSTGGFTYQWNARAIGFTPVQFNVTAFQPNDPSENATTSYIVVRIAEIDTDKEFYVQKEIVNITGSSYSPDNFISLWIKSLDNGGTALGYPQSIPTTSSGTLNTTFNITNYCAGNYQVIGTDQALPAILNASANFTVRGWWDSSWQKRKPLYLSNGLSQDRTGERIFINITGFGGDITDCINEIRVISTISGNDVPVNILAGDNSTYCEILFQGDISANAVNESNYYVYYDNPLATNPGYGTLLGYETIVTFDTFEIGLGNWSNVAGDQFDWTRDQGGTPTANTGPGTTPTNGFDHTIGDTSGWYMYTETSAPRVAGEEAFLESTNFTVGQLGSSMSLWYHMFGATMGSLHVDVWDGAWNLDEWSVAGEQHNPGSLPYTQTNVDLSSYSGTIRVRVRGTVGTSFTGDMAIDDLNISITNPAPNVTYAIGTLQDYFVCQDVDFRKPSVRNPNVDPNPQVIMQAVNITANVTDDHFMGTVIAQVTLPNSTIINLTMNDTNSDSVYNVTFETTPLIGLYNITFIAADSVGNINNTVKINFTIQLENLSLMTDSSDYVTEEIVYIFGKGFNPNVNVNVTIFDPTSDIVSGFPIQVLTNASGGFNTSWFIPLSGTLGVYSINATDQTQTDRSVNTTFEIVSAIVETNQSSYEQAETVYITGRIWDPDVNVTLNVTDPNGILVFGPVNVSTNSTGNFNTTWSIPFNETTGTHIITAYEPSNPLKKDDYSFAVTARTVSLTTQYPWYKTGETVNISGLGFSFNQNISIDIFNSTGQSVSGYPRNITSNSTGKINHTYLISNLPQGNYTIRANDTLYPNLGLTTVFDIVLAQIATDLGTYNSGDTVTLIGTYWDRNVNVTLDVINITSQSESGFPVNVSSDSSGGFIYQFTARAIGFTPVQFNVTAFQPNDLSENASTNYTVVRIATLETDKSYYAQLESVNITGNAYSPSDFVTLWIKSRNNGGDAIGYPQTIATDGFGQFNTLFDTNSYCPGNFSVIGTDQSLPSLLNDSVNFTIRGWWNSSWQRRKPILLSNQLSENITNGTIFLNITGLAGNITSCLNEIRIVSTVSGNDVPVNIINGDDTTYCYVSFQANIDANSLNIINYYAYYNNSQATNPGYARLSSIFGSGVDGSLVVASANTIVNNYTYLESNATGSSTSIVVNSTLGFSKGDEILIIQMQNGTSGSGGAYEFATILSITGTNLTLANALTGNYYTGGFNTTLSTITQVVRVPQHKDINISSGASLIPRAWDGFTGGILIFKAAGALTLNGTINATARGFRGGIGGISNGGFNGESYDGKNGQGGPGLGAGTQGGGAGRTSFTNSNGVRGGGGGGGYEDGADATNAGGGGGGGGYGGGGGGGGGAGDAALSGLGGSGGLTDVTGGGGGCAPGNAGGTSGANAGSSAASAGAGASACTGGTVGSGTTTGEGGSSTNGDVDGGGGGGGGGGLYGNSNLNIMFLGSGGGGGGDSDEGGAINGKTGGSGGGIVFVAANKISVSSTGNILSQGEIGLAGGTDTNDATGASGGGSGGSIYLMSSNMSIGTNLVNATGGSGGARGTGAGAAGSGGGGGGVGRIRLDYQDISGTASPTPGFTDDVSETFSSSDINAQAGSAQEYFVCIEIDITKPTVTINEPVNYYNTTDTTPQINFTITDNQDTLLNYSIYVDGIHNGQNNTIANNTPVLLNLTALSEGVHNITVQGKDDFSNIANASIIIIVDITGPETNITQPLNFTNITGNYTITASAYDNFTRVDTVTFIYRQNSTAAWNILCTDSLQPYTCQWNTSQYADGNSYQLRAYANDTVGNIGLNYSVTNLTIDNTGPVVTITAPLNFTNISSTTTFTITATAIDALLSIDSVLFYYRQNNTANWTFLSADVTEPYRHIWDVSLLPDGKYYQIRAIGNDTLGNLGAYDITYNISLDRTGPSFTNITIVPNPQNLGLIVNISANMTDLTRIDYVEADVTLPNGTHQFLRMTDENSDGVYNLTFSTTILTGLYNLTIFANDSLSNNATSQNKNFTVQYPNLTLITDFTEYVRGDTVFIRGNGFNAFTNVTVNIYNSTGQSVSGFPRNVFSNLTGGINDSWSIPGLQNLGFYTVNATDTSDNSRSANTSFEVVSAIIESDKASYEQGEIVYITGRNWDTNVNVTINITSPAGIEVYGQINVSSNSTGNINASWFIPYNETLGNHILRGFQPSNPEKFDDYTFTVTARPVSIITQYPWYKEDEVVNISGLGFSPDVNVTIDIYNSTGQSISGYPKNVTSNSTGGMNDSFTINSLLQGNYTILANDTIYPNLGAAYIFEIVVAQVTTDQDSYENGETVFIIGNYWDRNVNVTIDLINETGQSVTTFPLNVSSNSTGGFVYPWTAVAIGTGSTIYNISAFQPNDPGENATANFTVLRKVTLQTDEELYDQNETVNITGSFYTPLGNVELNIIELATGQHALNFPVSVSADSLGDIEFTAWNTSNYCEGVYLVTSLDQTFTILIANTTFNITYFDTNFSFEFADNGNLTLINGSNPVIGGSFSNTLANDSSVFSVGHENPLQDGFNETDVFVELAFNLTHINTSYDKIQYINILLDYCYSGSANTCDGSDPPDEAFYETNFAQVYNITSQEWQSIGTITVGSTNNPRVEEWNITGGFEHLVNSSGFIKLRWENHANYTVAANDNYFMIDYARLNVTYKYDVERSCVPFDIIPPTIISANATPNNVTLLSSINITANVTDASGISKVIAIITYPDFSQTNLTMNSLGNSLYNATFTQTTQTGNYNVTIWANDTWGNINTSVKANFTVNYYPLSLSTNTDKYVVGETVFITGSGFSPGRNVTLNIYNSTGQSVSGFPLNTTSNATGNINLTWLIPVGQGLGFYTVNATDVFNNTRSIETQFEIVTAIISTNKQLYEQAEIVNITGRFWDPFENVTINITDPNGVEIYGPINISSNATGYISWNWTSDFNATLGTYSLRAYQPSNPNKFGSQDFTITYRSVYIFTDSPWYKQDDIVLITGYGFSYSQNVTINIHNSTGQSIPGYPKNVTSNLTGGINDSFVVTNLVEGNYTINATDNKYTNLNNITIFEIALSTITTDKSAYINGEIVFITGSFWDKNINITIDIKNQSGVSISGYPKNVSSDNNGDISDSLIAAAIGLGITQYNITAFNPSNVAENDTTTYTVQRIAILSVDKDEYDQDELLNATGEFFSENGPVEILIGYLNRTGFILYYPKLVQSNATGAFVYNQSTSNLCNGNYFAEAQDEAFSTLYANITFNITHLSANISAGAANNSNATGTFNVYGGQTSSTQISDNSWQYIGGADYGVSERTSFLAYINYTFNITSLNAKPHRLKNLSFTVEYCHSGVQVNPTCNNVGNGFPHEGTTNTSQDIEIYNFSNNQWHNFSALSVNDVADAENTQRFSFATALSNFVRNNTIMVRFEVNFIQNESKDDVLLIDYLSMNVSYDSEVSKPCNPLSDKFLEINNYDKTHTIITSTKITVYNSTNSLIDNSTGQYFKYLPFDLLTISVATPFLSDNLTYELLDLNYSSSVNITSQVSENYTYSLPSLITNITPIVAVNDSLLTFQKAKLTVPKRSLDINTLLHCLNYNYSNGQCLQFSLNETSEFEYNENSNYIFFNVTSFDAFGGGQGDTLPNLTIIRIYNATGLSDTHQGGTLVSSGLNTTFNLSGNNLYRVEFAIKNDGRKWVITPADFAYHAGLNETWAINVTGDIWYTDGSNSTNFTGGNFTNGRAQWNLSQGGTYNSGETGVFYYVVNVTTFKTEFYPVRFVINDTSTISGSTDNSTYRIRDTIVPFISLNYPVQNDNLSAGILTFNWTAFDNTYLNLTCSLIINGQVNQSGINSQNNFSTTTTAQILSAGIYNWSVNCTDFDGNSNISETRNFTVIAGPQYININITSDNSSIRLNWSSSQFADTYNVYITLNYSQDFPTVANATGITDQNWTDINAFANERRYYKVAAVKGSAIAFSNISLGKHTTELLPTWNLISIPFNLTNWLLFNGTNSGRDIFTSPGECIISLWRFNSTNQSYERTDYVNRTWLPSTGSETFKALEEARGYWVEANSTCNMTFFGIVPQYNQTFALQQFFNIMGLYSGRDPLLYDESLLKPIDVIPADSVDVILRYNTTTNQFEVTAHFPGFGFFPSFNNQDFIYLNPIRGYYFDVLEAANWTHDPNKG